MLYLTASLVIYLSNTQGYEALAYLPVFKTFLQLHTERRRLTTQ